jgi:aldehyde dehydrogenase (NAD+)
LATAVSEAVKTHQLYIDGEWRDATGGETFPSINPSNEEVIANIPKGTREDAQAAISAARASFDRGDWAGKSFKARSEILLKAFKHLAEVAVERDWAGIESADAGVTLRLANLAHVPTGLEHFRSLVAQGGEIKEYEPLPWVDMPAVSWNFVNREPQGVCGQIIPWNFPFMMACWKLAPALVTGNSVVLKPASNTTLTALELVRALDETGLFPKGVINIVTGPGASVGEEIAANPDVDKVAFTGSTEVGRRIMQLASGTVKKVTLELGGKSANILLPDADLDLAIDGSLIATFWHQGQICESGTRLLVHESRHDEVLERLIARTKEIVVGPADDLESGMGPLVSEAQLATVKKYVEIGQQEGAKLVLGGKQPEGLEKGYFFEPTIFDGVTNDMRIAQEEIFGPVLSVLPTKTPARRSGSPTIRSTGWRAASGRPTSPRPSTSPRRSGPGRCGSTTTTSSTMSRPLAATSSRASARSWECRGCWSTPSPSTSTSPSASGPTASSGTPSCPRPWLTLSR